MDCPHCNHAVDLESKCRNSYCYNYEKHGERVMVESKFKGIKWALAKIELLETKNQELKAESALILATKAKQNTFWACKDHKLQSTLRCAICDEERIAELEAQLDAVIKDALTKSLKLAKANKRIKELEAELHDEGMALRKIRAFVQKNTNWGMSTEDALKRIKQVLEKGDE